MEIRPPPSEGKGGEVPLLHRPLCMLEQRGLTGQSELLIFRVLRHSRIQRWGLHRAVGERRVDPESRCPFLDCP